MTEQLLQQLSYLPEYLGGHLLLTFIALTLGILISFPLALSILRKPKLQWLTLAFASVMQTIPGIALLALMVPILGMIGFVPALIALLLYSMLPIIRNTITGINNIDPALKEAAMGIGMSYRQQLFEVELPLALPIIIAGIRTSAVWIVGTATLSTPVGAPSLGNYIFSGLHTQNYVAVMVGSVSAALLAILLDQLIRIVEIGISKRKKYLTISALVVFVLIFLAGAYQPLSKLFDNGQKKIVLGTKEFTEQYILGKLVSKHLESNGFELSVKQGLGSTILFDALRQNQIDCYIDYSGTVWTNYMKMKESKTREEVLSEMALWLKEKHQIISLGSLGFENKYALAMKREIAKARKIISIADLSLVSRELVMGSDYDFFSRPEWDDLKTAYSLDFKEKRTFDPSLMYSAVNQGEVDVIPAYSTDGRIIDFDLVLLDDPKSILPPYDAVILLSPNASQDIDLVIALNKLIGKISSDQMREANNLVDLKGTTVDSAALLMYEFLELEN